MIFFYITTRILDRQDPEKWLRVFGWVSCKAKQVYKKTMFLGEQKSTTLLLKRFRWEDQIEWEHKKYGRFQLSFGSQADMLNKSGFIDKICSAIWLLGQNNNVGIQKNFLSLLLSLKVDQTLFFHEAFLIDLTQKVLPNLGLSNKYIQGCGNTLRL